MAGKHYKNPDEFYEIVKNNKLFITGIVCYRIHVNYIESIIESIRNINKYDKGFIYTCKCNDTKIEWIFAYKSEGIRNIVKQNIRLSTIESRIKAKIEGNVMDESIVSDTLSNSDLCICPFDL